DGFTFGFIRRFWSLLEKDVVTVVKYFFTSGTFPKGCNASFIALIPKIPDAKMVKDFRPIILIGSLYKIIAKILANRFVGVLGDIVSEVQSDFVVDRQIIDGDVLSRFGFGSRWCGWIQECLRSSRASVLVNGSPTKEFQFYKGLKQGDPLSPFLFILVMESLHLSFKRVEDAGSKVEGCMSRIKSWDEIMEKMMNRLSKWKMKTLSIGGRLTLLKVVLGLCQFIICSYLSKKSTWVSWNKVLASKEKGGLGVSSLFALNRALMFKWVWQFFNQKDSLWAKVMQEIHGVDGRIGRDGKAGHASIWCDIIKEMDRLVTQGIDLVSMMQIKIGNGSNTSFLEDRWRGRKWCRIQTVEGYMLESLDGVLLSPVEDRWKWVLNGSGVFTVASARQYIDNKRLPGTSSKTRWIKEICASVVEAAKHQVSVMKILKLIKMAMKTIRLHWKNLFDLFHNLFT
nr:RNA-directed DNA polymerase, eukaryota, reverse transcriptase zinc-binding domain protein [Tanacetum cinerariifolium]